MTDPVLDKIATQVTDEVYHVNKWSNLLDKKIIDELKVLASRNIRKRARICLHPSIEENQQIMLIVLHKTAEDQEHYHPMKNEILIVVEGEANLIYTDETSEIIEEKTLSSENSFYTCTNKSQRHYLKIYSEWFVFWEIAPGPFNENSTIYI